MTGYPDCFCRLIASQATALGNALAARNVAAGQRHGNPSLGARSLGASAILSPLVAALVLLAAELLYLTFRFDTQGLLRSDSAFALILGMTDANQIFTTDTLGKCRGLRKERLP